MSLLYKIPCVLSESILDRREVSYRVARLVVSEAQLRAAGVSNPRALSIYGVPDTLATGRFHVIYALSRQTENGSILFDYLDEESAAAIAEVQGITLADVPSAPIVERDMNYRRAGAAPSRVTLGGTVPAVRLDTEVPF